METETLQIKTSRREDLIDITDQVQQAVARQGLQDGRVFLHCPHTTCGLTINENADPDVAHDILLALKRLVPHNSKGFRHAEGNSDAHVKASMMGCGLNVFVEHGGLVLGTWQGIYLCDFDGPRTRRVLVRSTAWRD